MISFFVLGGSILASYYFAMTYESPEFMLLVYLQAALFVLSGFTVLYRKFTITGEFDIPVGIAEPDRDNLVKLQITNKGLLPMTRLKALLEVEDVGSGTVTKRWMQVSSVWKGKTNFVCTMAFGGAGTYLVRLKKLKVYDFTGLFYAKVPASGEKKIQVMPRIYTIPIQLSPMVRNFFGESEVYDDYEPGYDNSELFDVREYQEGDGLRKIHWKLSAKKGELLVKEFALPKACPIVLFLDFHPTGKIKKQEQMIPYLEGVASLVYSLFDVKCPHYVVWYDEKRQDVVRHRIDEEESLFFFLGTLMEIAWAQPTESLQFEYLERYKREPYIWALSLDENLVLKKGDEVLAQFSEADMERSLRQTALML